MKKYFPFLLGLISLMFVLSGCVEEPEIRGVSNFQLDKITQEKLSFNLDVEVYNPNNYKLKVRKSTFDLYLNDTYVGEAYLLDKYKMDKMTTTLSNVPVEVLLEKGVFIKLFSVLAGKKVEVRLVGKLKATAKGWPVSKKIDESKQIDLSDFNLNIQDLFN